jgi:hypothetical protein
MTPEDLPRADTAERGPPIEPIRQRIVAAFDVFAETTRAFPGVDRAVAGRLRGPLGRLVQVGQARDMAEQRLAHVRAARAAPGPGERRLRAAVDHVAAAQIADLARLLARTGEAAEFALATIEEQVESLASEAPDSLPGFRGLIAEARRAGAALDAAVEALETAARTVAAGIEEDPAEALREADLAWMHRLYTMEDERRVHRAAVLGAGASG